MKFVFVLLALSAFAICANASPVEQEKRGIVDIYEQLIGQHKDLFVKIQDFLKQQGIDLSSYVTSPASLLSLMNAESFKKIQILAATFLATHPDSLKEFTQLVSSLKQLIPSSAPNAIPSVINQQLIANIEKYIQDNADSLAKYPQLLSKLQALLAKLKNGDSLARIDWGQIISIGAQILPTIIPILVGKRSADSTYELAIIQQLIANIEKYIQDKAEVLAPELLNKLQALLAQLKNTNSLARIDWGQIISIGAQILPTILPILVGKRSTNSAYEQFLEQHKQIIGILTKLFSDNGIDINALIASGNLANAITPDLAKKMTDLFGSFMASNPSLVGEFMQFLMGLKTLMPQLGF